MRNHSNPKRIPLILLQETSVMRFGFANVCKLYCGDASESSNFPVFEKEAVSEKSRTHVHPDTCA